MTKKRDELHRMETDGLTVEKETAVAAKGKAERHFEMISSGLSSNVAGDEGTLQEQLMGWLVYITDQSLPGQNE